MSHNEGQYARFTMGGTYDGDTTMHCTDCDREVALWRWQDPHTLTDYLASADAHNAERHATPAPIPPTSQGEEQ